MRALAVALAVSWAVPALAEAPTAVLRPVARPAPEAPLRPLPRPLAWGGDLGADAVAEAPPVAAAAALPALRPTIRPVARAEVPVSAAPAAAAPERSAMAGPAAMADPAAPAWGGPVPPVRPRPAPPGRPEARPVAAPAPAPAPLEARLSTRAHVPPQILRAEELLAPVVEAVFVVPEAATLWGGPRPGARPAAFVVPSFAPAEMPDLRPAVRPRGYGEMRRGLAVQVAMAPAWLSPLAVARAPRPELRPRLVSQRAAAVRVPAPAAAPPGATGAPLPEGPGLCGLAVLQGAFVGDVPGPGSCGVEDAVRVTAVGGVRLSRPATMDCPTARALATWVERVARPAVGATGGGLVRLEVAGDYSCRPRNNQAGNRLSEHGAGRAIDIAGFRLADGQRITVLGDWGSGTGGQILRAVHREACGIFGTVLGPDADRFHRDHFHFDTARHRSGSYCQ
jgi:hypothetical protein